MKVTRIEGYALAAAVLAVGASCLPVAADEGKAPGGGMPPAVGQQNLPAGQPAEQPVRAGGQAQDPRDREIAELKRIVEELRARLAESEALKQVIEQLMRRIEALEQSRPAPAPPEPAPQPAEATRPAATLLPNISVVGNLIARGGDYRGIDHRGKVNFEELEIAFQDAVAPKLRYDVYIAAGKEEDWAVEMEEGFLTASAVAPRLTLRGGRIRTAIDKFNPLHPHQWVFVTQPAAHAALVGDHGLISDGAVAEYLLPVKGLYANLQLGLWQTTSIHHHEEEGHEHEAKHARRRRLFGAPPAGEEEEGPEFGFNGGDETAYSARLALGKEVGRDREMELGIGRYWGRGEVHDFERRKLLALNAVDLTYRSYPGAYRRLLLQADLLAHETRGVRGDAKFRLGGYLLGAYKWNRYWEAGLRGDYTKYPFPFDGKEWGASAFLTRYLTEQTSLRVEYRYANSTEFGGGNGIFFQVLFGSGPHTHPLQ